MSMMSCTLCLLTMIILQAVRDALSTESPQHYIFEGMEPSEVESALSRAIRDHGVRLRDSFELIAGEVRSAVSALLS
jgi:hypothetical protein